MDAAQLAVRARLIGAVANTSCSPKFATVATDQGSLSWCRSFCFVPTFGHYSQQGGLESRRKNSSRGFVEGSDAPPPRTFKPMARNMLGVFPATGCCGGKSNASPLIHRSSLRDTTRADRLILLDAVKTVGRLRENKHTKARSRADMKRKHNAES